LLGANKGNIQVLDAKQGVLKIVASRGFKQDFLDCFSEVSAADGSACGKALQSGNRIVIEDVSRAIHSSFFCAQSHVQQASVQCSQRRS
jgi:hypothetical protein